MSEIVDLMVSFPTVVFTVPLVICLVWFLFITLMSGLDIGLDLDADVDGGDLGGFDQLTAALHLGALGLPLALLLLSFGAWASSLLFSLAMEAAGVGTALTIAGGLIVGMTAGTMFLRSVGGPIGRALATDEAPLRATAIGSTCRIRTVEVTETFGDAEILTGPMSTSIVKVRAPSGTFRRGDIALLIELDSETEAFWIAEIDEQFQPHK